MTATRWLLTVRQVRPAEVRVGALKAALGGEDVVAVGGRERTDTDVCFDYATEEEARTAQAVAEEVSPNARCMVDAYVPDALSEDR